MKNLKIRFAFQSKNELGTRIQKYNSFFDLKTKRSLKIFHFSFFNFKTKIEK